MPTVQKKIINAGDMSADIISSVIDLGGISLGSIQSVFTGSPIGSLFLEISNDIISLGSDPNTQVTNWNTYGTALAVSAAGSFVSNISNMGYKWLQIGRAHV